MRKLFILSLLTVTALACSAARAEEQTLDSITDHIATAWEKVKSYSADMTMDATVPMGPVSVSSKGTGTVEFMLIDDKPKFRMEMQNKLGGNMPLMGGGMEQHIISVYNGDMIYGEMEAMGMKKYTKAKPKADDTQSPVGGKSLIEKMRKQGEVKLLPDEQVNGLDTYVLEVKPNNAGQQEGPVKAELMRFYIAKDSGIQVRTVAMNAEGSPVLTIDYANLKVNPEIDPKRFDFMPPPGADVIDMGDGTKRPKLF